MNELPFFCKNYVFCENWVALSRFLGIGLRQNAKGRMADELQLEG